MNKDMFLEWLQKFEFETEKFGLDDVEELTIVRVIWGIRNAIQMGYFDEDVPE